MSLGGVIAMRGATVRIRRAVQTQGADGATQRTWRDAPTRRATMLLEELSAEKAQRLWGIETVARFRATLEAEADVRKYDGVIVEDGRFVGLHLRVEEDPRGSELGPQLTLLGLALTKETFGL